MLQISISGNMRVLLKYYPWNPLQILLYKYVRCGKGEGEFDNSYLILEMLFVFFFFFLLLSDL
jgi:hypothetical protein